MDRNTIVQYTLVGIILLCVIVWIVFRIFFKKNRKGNSCYGCSLSDKCSGRRKNK